MHRGHLRRLASAAAAVWLVTAGEPLAGATEDDHAKVVQLAQQTEAPPRELEPRYQPAPPQEKSWYNDSYLFGLTRGVANSTMVPAAKVPLFVLTLPLDLALLPFAAIGGLFG